MIPDEHTHYKVDLTVDIVDANGICCTWNTKEKNTKISRTCQVYQIESDWPK
jgi:hypothetical protein